MAMREDAPADGAPPEATLSERTSSSILWMTLQRWATRIGALVTLMILTRLLAPEDFGLASAATTLIPVLYVIADMGFSTYIVQATDLTRRTTNTAFWFSVTCGLLLAGAIALAAPLLALMLGEPGVSPLVQVMATSIVIVAITSVPISLLRRRMQFRTLAIVEVASALGAQVVAIAAAFAGAGAWALVLQVLASQLVYGVIVWAVTRWRPGGGFAWSELRSMARFGLPVVGSGLVGMSRAWVETVIIISALGVREMGFIIIAQRLVLTAQELSVSALLPVATAAFARLKLTPERLRSAYLRASAISYAAVTPLMVFVGVAAPVMVPFLFGTDKQHSADLVPAIVAVVLLNVSWAIDQGLYLGIGRPLRWFVLVTVSSVIALVSFGVAAGYGLLALLIAWVVIAFAEAVARWFVLSPVIKASPFAIAGTQLGAVIPAAIAAACGFGLLQLLSGAPEILALAASGIVVLVSYLTVTRFLRVRVFVDTVTMLPRRLAAPLRWALPRSIRTAPPEERNVDA
ncbi:oligosaccharide flippase family protein [Microbacterium sp. RD1]|uniref:oligosaccharide flippase family protein n=1 Tax=Microbacterium sp. RD1 TaxID=3457313 RepID=UPI003FA5E196